MAQSGCANCGGMIDKSIRLDCTHGDYCSIDCATTRAEQLGIN